MLGCPANQHGIGLIRIVGHALPQLGQKSALQANFTKALKQFIQRLFTQRGRSVPYRMGRLTSRLTFCYLVRNAAQVLDQHHPQRGGQRPQFAQAEFANLLVRI